MKPRNNLRVGEFCVCEPLKSHLNIPCFFQFQGNPLIHSIKSAAATGLIYGSELSQAVQEVMADVRRHVGDQLFVSTDAVTTQSESHNNAKISQNAQIVDSNVVDFDVALMEESSPSPPQKTFTEQLQVYPLLPELLLCLPIYLLFPSNHQELCFTNP